MSCGIMLLGEGLVCQDLCSVDCFDVLFVMFCFYFGIFVVLFVSC